MKRVEVYLILGMYFGLGALLGYVIGKEKHPKRANTVLWISRDLSGQVVKEGDKILIYLSRCSEGALRDEHYSGELVFEYNKNKEVDKTAYRFTLNRTCSSSGEFEEVWEEVRGY